MTPVVCILGMHRSRTSLVTRALNLAGLRLGDPSALHHSSESNPKGFWEYTEIVDRHDAILETMDRHWHTAFPLPDGWRQNPKIEEHRAALLEILRKETYKSGTWAFKDPRTCLMLPMWFDLFDEAEIDGHFLLCLRNPLDIARSLETRDGFPIVQGLGIWLHYMLTTATTIRDRKHIVVLDQEYVEDPEKASRRTLAHLEIRARGNQNEFFDSLVDPTLLHWNSSEQETLAALPEPCATLWKGLLNAAQHDGGSLQSVAGIDKMLTDYRCCASLLRHDVDSSFNAHRATLEVLEDLRKHHQSTKEEQSRYINDLKREISTRGKYIDSLQEHLAAARDEQSSLTSPPATGNEPNPHE